MVLSTVEDEFIAVLWHWIHASMCGFHLPRFFVPESVFFRSFVLYE